MSVAINTEVGADKDAYDKQFDDNHTVHDEKVSTCTYLPNGVGACHTCV